MGTVLWLPFHHSSLSLSSNTLSTSLAPGQQRVDRLLPSPLLLRPVTRSNPHSFHRRTRFRKMKCTALALFALALVAPAGLVSAGSSSKTCHRRHHQRIASAARASSNSSSEYTSAYSSYEATKTAAASSSSNNNYDSQPTSGTSYSNSSSSSSSKNWGMPDWGVKANGLHFGLLPDDGSGGGSPQLMKELNSAMGAKSSAYGYYAQARSGTPFDGQQLKWRLDDILEAGGVFQPAVMPTGGWQGLKYDDDSQAVNIANVMKWFQDQGVEHIWLRFAHEVNYYQEDGTYQGDVNDFKEGWDVVAKAVRRIAPGVRMWYTPNIKDLNQYDEFFPTDVSTVDLIGVDYYPKELSDTTFLDAMKGFHDKYCSENLLFAIGEIGLGNEADMDTRLRWLKQMTSAETQKQMPYYKQVSWFNYWKGYEFRIAGLSGADGVYNYLKYGS